MRYQKIYVQIWNDEKFIELSEPSKIFFLYLLTSPHSNLIGAFVIKKGYIAEDLKWSIVRVDKAIKELVKEELILFDVKVSVVAVSNYLKYNPLENPNQFTGAVKIYKSLPRTSILSSVFNMLVTLAKRFNRPFEGASKPEAVTVTEAGAETTTEPEEEILKDVWILPKDIKQEVWQEYEDHRKTTKTKLTDAARTKNANVLLGNLPDQQEIVDATIANGWTGLFQPKKGNVFKSREEKNAEAKEAFLNSVTNEKDITPIMEAIE
jgi:hypothetical protein